MEVLVEVERFLECFGVKDVSVWEIDAFVDSEVKKVNGGGRRFMSKAEVGMKGIEIIEEEEELVWGCCPY